MEGVWGTGRFPRSRSRRHLVGAELLLPPVRVAAVEPALHLPHVRGDADWWQKQLGSDKVPPAELKAEIAHPAVEATPTNADERPAVARTLERFGEPVEGPRGGVAVRLVHGHDLTDVVRALDQEGIAVDHLQLHAPTLDDVFLAKTGHRLEGAAEEPEAVAAP